MTSSFLVKIASLHTLLLNKKWLSVCLLSTRNRFNTNNISHLRLFWQYTNHVVLKEILLEIGFIEKMRTA